MAVVKVTKRDNFNAIIEVLKAQGKDELVAFCEHEIELLGRKHGDSKAVQAKKAENADLAKKVYAILSTSTEGMTATDVAKALGNEVGADFSNQKATALIKLLGDRVVATMNGKRKIFTVA